MQCLAIKKHPSPANDSGERAFKSYSSPANGSGERDSLFLIYVNFIIIYILFPVKEINLLMGDWYFELRNIL